LVNKNLSLIFSKAQFFLGFLFILLLLSCTFRTPYVSLKGNTMGTTYSILLVPGPNEEVDLVKLQFGIDSVLYEVNSQMSTYIVNSE